MILFQGRRWESEEQNRLLDRLEGCVEEALAGPALNPETVIAACSRLSGKIAAGDYDEIIRGLELDGAEEKVEEAAALFRRNSLEYRLETELGPEFRKGGGISRRLEPPFGTASVQRLLPLGVLFHIAAGNVDGLPAYSAVEGLLTGNVNILKLPQADNGLSAALLEELIRLAPELKNFLFVFDTPSADLKAIERMAGLADGVVVWGGDEAVSAARRLTLPGTRLIEWGHKLGFCYLVPGAVEDGDLESLAEHIMVTRQLLCSSCQTAYLDTDSPEEADRFCRRFLPFLERAAERHPNGDPAVRAELSLRRYERRLEGILSGERGEKRYQGKGCGLLWKEDSALELSPLFGTCLVKRLPRRNILRVLRRSRGYLQTAGLVCGPEDRRELEDLLFRAGVVKVCAPADMSVPSCCQGHDGEYPLRRYLRVADSLPPGEAGNF